MGPAFSLSLRDLPFFLMLLAVALGSVRPAREHPWGIGIVSALAHCLLGFPMQRLAISALLFALLGALAAAAAGDDSFRLRSAPSQGLR